MKIKITNKSIMFIGIEILLFLTLLPITQCFPSIIRWILQITSIGLFILGLLLEKNKRYLLGYLACVTFSFLYVYNVWKFNQSIVTCIFNVMAGFTFAFFGVISMTQENPGKNYQKKVATSAITLVVITAVTTILGLQRYPLAVRELGRVGSGYSSSGQAFLELKFKYKLMNIASWSIVYGIVFTMPWFINQYKENRKIRYLVGMGIVIVCLLKAQLTIGIIVSALLAFFSIYQPGHKPKDVLLSMMIVLAGILLVVFSNRILLFIVQVTGNLHLRMISDKLQDLLFLLQGNQTGNVLARVERYTRSLDHFLEHPLLGLSIYGVPNDGMFGNHSDFFDMLGYYGLFGVVIVLAIILAYLGDVKKSIRIKNRWNVLVPFIGLILVFILNPVWYSPQVFATAIMLPCCTYLKDFKSNFAHSRRLLIWKSAPLE